MTEILVRRAIDSDIEWITAELKKFSEFYDSKHSLFGGETYVTAALATVIDKHVLLIAETKDLNPVGFISGFLHPHDYNPGVIVLSHSFFWVHEDYRNSKAAYLLLKEFTEIGKFNCHWITLQIPDVSPLTERSLLKRGYKLKEKTYLMEVV
jgi:hypothetical protein